ncbi:hypothetical protein PIB30_005894 [Stylosanthes scabra]|uniref:Uncharacterized protein n=1 Tax=Stylosanthes scabra TaxID=79078 RepID=A0ABU6Q475_9FABA|nr:hypothetical protein [Stylosanthes scabra]
MAKHSVCHALAIILIIAAIIYSTIANDFHETALTKQKSTRKQSKSYWRPRYYDAFHLDSCIKQCSEKIQDNEQRLERCKEKCKMLKGCMNECDEMFADKKERRNCYKGCKFEKRGTHGFQNNPYLKREDDKQNNITKRN